MMLGPAATAFARIYQFGFVSSVVADVVRSVPVRYAGTLPTRSESYLIAIIALVVSTAFWATVTAAIGSLRQTHPTNAA